MNCHGSGCVEEADRLVPSVPYGVESMHELAAAQIRPLCKTHADVAEDKYTKAASMMVIKDVQSGRRADAQDVAAIGNQLQEFRSDAGQTTWALIASYYGVE